MKALVRLIENTYLIAPFIEQLERFGYRIVEEEESPNLVVSDDPKFLLGRMPEVVKIFVHDPSSTPQEIAKGVLCFSPDQVLRRFEKRPLEV